MDRQLLIIGSAVILTIVLVLGAASINDIDRFSSKGDAAVIPLSGSVTPEAATGLTAGQSITPGLVRQMNKDAKKKGADAIIYEINSGGGTVVASKEVYREIESVEMPTVCRFRDISASGAYLFALGCDRIVADSATLTGSIGVRSSYFEFTGLMNRYGVERVNISSGKYKELGSPYQNITEEERRILQQKAEKIHEEFLSLVVENRNLSEDQVEEIRTGEPFLGGKAEELNLVDDTGGREIAVEHAEELTDKELNTFKVEKQIPFNFFSLLTADLPLENILGKDLPFKAVY